MTRQLDQQMLSRLSERDLKLLIWRQKWLNTARPKQLPPDLVDHGNGIDQEWTEWGLCMGRGAGKTRVGGEWLAHAAITDPNAYPSYVIAPTLNDVRYTCFEGESGILSHLPTEVVKDYNKTNLIITLDTGAIIRGFSAEEPERLRGPQAARAWCFPGHTLVTMGDGRQKRIDRIVAGERVTTRSGPKKVLAAALSSNTNPLYELEYGSMKLTATADHPILANGRWTPMSDVKVGDELCVIDASFLLATAGTSTTPIRGITNALTRAFSRRKPDAFTGQSGSFTTDRSPKDGTSTTKTKTSPTTILTTWNACLAGITYDITLLAGKNQKLKSRRSASERLRSGKKASSRSEPARIVKHNSCPELGARMRAFFAPLTAVKSGGPFVFHPSNAFATTAGFSISRPSVSSATAQNFATTRQPVSASKRHLFFDKSPAHIAKLSLKANGPTRGSAATLVPKGITTSIVKSVRRLDTSEPVYDLAVDQSHEFFANGVLVHNCDEIAAWTVGEDTWNMMMFGLRLGKNPRVVWTTTPKPKDLIRTLIKPQAHRHITTGSSHENRSNLAPTFFNQLAQYDGTQLGRQEIEGELIDAEEGGIINRSWLQLWPAGKPFPKFEWIVMSLDTAFTERTIDKKTHNADPTACGVFGVFWHEDIQHVMLLDCWQDHLGLPDLVKRVKKEMNVPYGDDIRSPTITPLIGPKRMAGSGRKPDIILIEDKGSGISLRQSLSQDGIFTYAYNPGRADKLTRLHLSSDVFARRQFWVPESEKFPKKPRTWADPLITQLCSFRGPNSVKHDDFVDVVTQATIFLKTKNMLDTMKKPKPEREREDNERAPRYTTRGNPYAQ